MWCMFPKKLKKTACVSECIGSMCEVTTIDRWMCLARRHDSSIRMVDRFENSNLHWHHFRHFFSHNGTVFFQWRMRHTQFKERRSASMLLSCVMRRHVWTVTCMTFVPNCHLSVQKPFSHNFGSTIRLIVTYSDVGRSHTTVTHIVLWGKVFQEQNISSTWIRTRRCLFFRLIIGGKNVVLNSRPARFQWQVKWNLARNNRASASGGFSAATTVRYVARCHS